MVVATLGKNRFLQLRPWLTATARMHNFDYTARRLTPTGRSYSCAFQRRFDGRVVLVFVKMDREMLLLVDRFWYS